MIPAISVADVTKTFRLYHDKNQTLKATLMRGRRARYEEFLALDDVSLDIEAGSTFGFIGHNGSGKSTLLKCMARILRPDGGRIDVKGKVSALLELGAGFHPELSGKENIFLNGAILGIPTKDISRKYDEIVEFAGLERFIDTPVKNYSSGMYVRLGFSVAINVEPDVLLIDEVLAVGDEEFQRKCNEKFADLRAQDKTIVVVSHGLGAMRNMCDQIAWLEHGKLRMVGDAGEVIDRYIAEVQTDRVEDSGDGSARWGSGELRVERVEVLDDNGEPTNRLTTGERITLRLHYRADGADPATGLRGGDPHARRGSRHRSEHEGGGHRLRATGRHRPPRPRRRPVPAAPWRLRHLGIGLRPPRHPPVRLPPERATRRRRPGNTPRDVRRRRLTRRAMGRRRDQRETAGGPRDARSTSLPSHSWPSGRRPTTQATLRPACAPSSPISSSSPTSPFSPMRSRTC